jgi:hypothetical protein
VHPILLSDRVLWVWSVYLCYSVCPVLLTTFAVSGTGGESSVKNYSPLFFWMISSATARGTSE